MTNVTCCPAVSPDLCRLKMLLKMQRLELLAPAGAFDSLTAAIDAGADAVYFGVEQLNMRARSANNFTLVDLPEVSRLCRAAGVRSYITLNTVLYDHDLPMMRRIVAAAAEHQIDAVIAMEPGVMQYARELGVDVHLSTQANITNVEAVKFYAQFAEVMVLSRELTLSQVAYISRAVEQQNICGPSGKPVQIEAFVHGALCMAVSGKCYLSLHTHNSSANRGACKQNCRRTYTVKDEEGHELLIDNEYIMSPKDLNTIGFLDKLVVAGVGVFKIEGRSKGPEYVYEVTRCYREALDAIQDGTFSSTKVDAWMERLEQVYNRGFWGGYYLGQKMGEWTDAPGSVAKERKVFLGTGIKYFSGIGIGEFKLQSGDLRLGDEVIITGPTTGYLRTKVTSLHLEEQPVEAINRRGAHFSMPVGEKIRPSDKLYKVEPNTN
jgi:putative protease